MNSVVGYRDDHLSLANVNKTLGSDHMPEPSAIQNKNSNDQELLTQNCGSTNDLNIWRINNNNNSNINESNNNKNKRSLNNKGSKYIIIAFCFIS